jgi:hypothetical protein
MVGEGQTHHILTKKKSELAYWRRTREVAELAKRYNPGTSVA